MGKSSTDVLYDFLKGLSPVFDALEVVTSIKNEIERPVSNGNNAGCRSTKIRTDGRPTDPAERHRQYMNAQTFVHGKCKKCLQEVTFKWFIPPGIFRRGSPTPNFCPHCKKILEPIEYAYVDKER